MTPRGLALVIMAASLMSIASLLLRSGIAQIGGFGMNGRGLFNDILALLRNPLLILGVILYGAGTLVWMRVISTEPLSISYPILVSLAFIVITLGAVFFFSERLSLTQIAGVVVIIVGVVIVSNG